MSNKIKTIGKHTLKYIVFLVAVMAWMILLGPKDTLTANEELYVQEFIAELESEPIKDNQLVEESSTQTEAPPTQVASEDSPTQTASEVSPTQVASNIKSGIINENSVRVRTGPGIDYEIARLLFQGNEVELVEEMDGGWWKIILNDSFFYVKSDYVNVQTLSGFNQ